MLSLKSESVLVRVATASLYTSRDRKRYIAWYECKVCCEFKVQSTSAKCGTREKKVFSIAIFLVASLRLFIRLVLLVLLLDNQTRPQRLL